MKRIIPILIVVALAVGGYYLWQQYGPGASSASAALGGSGPIEAEQIAITPQTTGRIVSSPPQEGVAVAKGDVLYKLDDSLLKMQVDTAQSGVDAAEENYKSVKDASNSTKAKRAAAKAQLEQAKIARDMAKVQLGYATIKSPSDGVLSNIAANAGENAVPGSTLAIVSQISKLTVTIYVPENEIGQVKLGQQGDITTDSTSKTYTGQVSFIASQAEFTPASIETKDQRVKLVYQVKLDITNADSALKPGMPADVVLK